MVSKFLALFLFIFCTSQTAFSSERTYTIGVASWIGWSFAHVAAEQGFFEDAGLKVEVRWFKEPDQISEAFEKGEIQFRFDFVATVVHEYLSGKDRVLLAETNWSHGGDKVLAKKGATFESRLGATIGVYRNSPALIYFLSVYLNKHNLRLSQFKIKPMPIHELTQEFINDNLSFIVIFDPYTIDAVADGRAIVKANSSQFPGCMPEGFFSTRATWNAMSNEEQVAMMGAMVRASEWIRDESHWPRYRYILNEVVFPDQEEFDEKQLQAMLNFVKIHGTKVMHNRNRDNGGLANYLNDLKKFLKRNNFLPKDYKPEDILDNRALMQALDQMN